MPALPLIIGLLFGFVTRFVTLRIDYRQYPGYPAGYTSHLTFGFIAAFIGALVVPAFIAKEYTAVSFLALAAQQFSQIRMVERKSLESIEQYTLVKRGPEYIEGIARTFEQRNYLTMLVGMISSAAASWMWWAGIVVGLAGIGVSLLAKSGETIGDLMWVRPGKLWFERTLLYVDDVMMMEVGMPHPRERYLRDGMGVVLEPKNPLGQAVLWDLSQREAMVYDAVQMVGVQKDVGYPEQTPLCRMEMPGASGRAALSIIPVEKDMKALIEAVQGTPVLESTKANPLVSKYIKQLKKKGRKGAVDDEGKR